MGIKDSKKSIKNGLAVGKGIKDEFKEFIAQGNVIDLAVGVVIGTAFAAITSSLVDDVIMPIVGILIGGFNFSELAITVGQAEVKYGSFIQAAVNFFIIAAVIFAFVKVINTLKSSVSKKTKEQVEDKAVKKIEDRQLEILEEIRDSLKNQKKSK